MLLLDDDDQLAARLSWPTVLTALKGAFRDPSRFLTAERVALAAPRGGSFLTMPCADAEGYFGVKQVTVLPDNPQRGLPSVQAWYTLFAPDGTPALACSASLLTRWRTAAVSALAAEVLAPEGARTLLVCGTGSLAPWLAEAHLQVRAYRRVRVWGRRAEAAEATVRDIEARVAGANEPPEVAPASRLAAAVGEADVVSCATTARQPFLRGEWLHPGQHVDLVGAFTPEMAEADAEAVRGCDVVVDERQAARAEAGELIRAADAGWSFDEVSADLSELLGGGFARGSRPTLFKSVGLALEDLAVARLLLDPPDAR